MKLFYSLLLLLTLCQSDTLHNFLKKQNQDNLLTECHDALLALPANEYVKSGFPSCHKICTLIQKTLQESFFANYIVSKSGSMRACAVGIIPNKVASSWITFSGKENKYIFTDVNLIGYDAGNDLSKSILQEQKKTINNLVKPSDEKRYWSKQGKCAEDKLLTYVGINKIGLIDKTQGFLMYTGWEPCGITQTVFEIYKNKYGDWRCGYTYDYQKEWTEATKLVPLSLPASGSSSSDPSSGKYVGIICPKPIKEQKSKTMKEIDKNFKCNNERTLCRGTYILLKSDYITNKFPQKILQFPEETSHMEIIYLDDDKCEYFIALESEKKIEELLPSEKELSNYLVPKECVPKKDEEEEQDPKKKKKGQGGILKPSSKIKVPILYLRIESNFFHDLSTLPHPDCIANGDYYYNDPTSYLKIIEELGIDEKDFEDYQQLFPFSASKYISHDGYEYRVENWDQYTEFLFRLQKKLDSM